MQATRILKCVLECDENLQANLIGYIIIDSVFCNRVLEAQKIAKAKNFVKWVAIEAKIQAYEFEYTEEIEEEEVLEVKEINTPNQYFKLVPTVCNVYKNGIDFEGIGKYNYCLYTAKRLSMNDINLNIPFQNDKIRS